MKKVILICGVSGSGKTWVAKQLDPEKFAYISHDQYRDDLPTVIQAVSETTTRPVVTECPFGERVLKEKLEKMRLEVIPVFIVEEPSLIAKRYMEREGKAIGKAPMTRATTIKDRVKEWDAFSGTSKEVLEYLEKGKFK